MAWRRTAVAIVLVASTAACRRRAQPPTLAIAAAPSTSASVSASASAKPPVPIDPISSHPLAVAIGADRACVARADGHVVCFGPKQPLSLVEGLTEVVQLSAHDSRWCALHRQGFVTCWKAGAPERHAIAVTRGIELGDSCVRVEDGRVSCWSFDANGVPTALEYVSTIGSARMLARGRANTHCIVRSDLKISCWGENATGQIGDETNKPRTTPYILPGLDDVEEAVVDDRAGSCGRVADKLTCWGGDWIAPKKRRGPDSLPKGTMQVAMSETHACARIIDGRLACFAVGKKALPPPAEIPGLNDVVHVAVGKGSTCVLTRRGKLLCWGDINDKKIPTEVALTALAPAP